MTKHLLLISLISFSAVVVATDKPTVFENDTGAIVSYGDYAGSYDVPLVAPNMVAIVNYVEPPVLLNPTRHIEYLELYGKGHVPAKEAKARSPTS